MSTIQRIAVAQGQTSKIINIYIENTGGTGLTGLTNATASLTAFFIREEDSSSTVISLSAGTLGTYGSGDFKEVDATNQKGVYQFGIPDAVLATGDNSAKIVFRGATSMDDCIIDIDLTKFDYNNGRIDLKSTGLDQVVIETGLTAKQALSVIGSALAGVLSGAGTTSIIIKAANDNATTRITATVDANGNRSVVTVSPP